MPIVLTTELRDEFFGLESDIRTRVHVLLVQPCIYIAPSPNKCHRTRRFFHWHILLFHLTRPIFLPNDRVVRHPRLHGLPEYLFGEVRGQSAHDGLKALCPVDL